MPGRVQRLDHRLELLHLADGTRRAPGVVDGVAVVRGEEGDRVVAPVVAQAALDEVVVVDELVHRHQLDGRDAERGEVLDDGRVGDAPSTCRGCSSGTPGWRIVRPRTWAS